MSYLYETEAYQCDGALYCPDCWQPCEDERCHEGCRVGGSHDVLGESMRDGDTCGACGACWVDGEWLEGDSARALRWSRCYRCNGQRPWASVDSSTRLAALRGRLECECCGAAAVHFESRTEARHA